MKDKFFTWSNVISFSRLFVAFPIIYVHYINNLQATALVTVLIIYGVVSDYLDGVVARMTNQISEWGKILDPVADKLAAFVLFSYTVYLGWIPLWFYVLGISRDALIMGGSSLIRAKRGKVPMSVMSGKISVNAMALYWIVSFYAPMAEPYVTILMWTTVAMMTYSFIEYIYRFYKIYKGAAFN